MSNQQILEKAVQKASDNGLRVDWTSKGTFRVWSDRQYLLEDGSAGIDIDVKEYSLSSPKEFIFNHDFVKALWGEEAIDMSDSAAGMSINFNSEPAWKTHLQRMVIADDPIKYLGENLGA